MLSIPIRPMFVNTASGDPLFCTVRIIASPSSPDPDHEGRVDYLLSCIRCVEDGNENGTVL